jgi:hypothetical protein
MRGAAHLFHEAALAITVSINLGVELVHQTGLLVLARDRVTGVGVVGISPGTLLGESVGKTVLGGVSAVIAGEVVVLLAVVTSGAETSTGGVQLTLIEAGSIVTVTGSVVVVTMAGSTANVVVVVVARAFTDGTEATSCASTNVLRDTLESIIALLAAGKSSTLVLELVHGHGRKSSGAVVGGLVVVNLVDGNGGVNNVGLDGLLLDDRLDSLVDVVVNVLTANGSSGALAVCGAIYATLILEASLLVDKVPLGGVVITVVELAMLNGTKLSSVLLGEDLAVLDGLDCAVVVVLVDLLINSSLNLLVNVRLDNLVLNSRSNSLVDSGVVVSRLRHEVGDSCLSLVHCEVLY